MTKYRIIYLKPLYFTKIESFVTFLGINFFDFSFLRMARRNNWIIVILSKLVLNFVHFFRWYSAANIETQTARTLFIDTSSFLNCSTNVSMDTSLFNHTHQALVLFTVEVDHADNISEMDVNITKTMSRLSSPLAVTVAVLLVFLFSPMILIGNSLVLVAMYRFKRLRTPSNYLVMSLATSDLGIGMFMPIGMYLELGGAKNFTSSRVCLLSYGVAISLCCVSVLVMVAIAVDRFTSLARPLRYPNLITHSAVERYIMVFWAYSSLVGFTPLVYSIIHDNTIE